MDYLDTLSRFASHLQYAALPGAVRQQLGWVLADTLAAVVGGSAEPELRAMAQRVALGQGATLVGLGRQASAMEAALVNASAGTFLEMDEGNRYSRGHPAIHALPAVLALAEVQQADAHRFLAALLVGYEVGSRFGAAARLRGCAPACTRTAPGAPSARPPAARTCSGPTPAPCATASTWRHR